MSQDKYREGKRFKQWIKPFKWIDASRAEFVGGNQVQLLEGGAQYFAALIQAIDAAQHSIYLETYIFHHDATGEQVLQALCNASRRGVQVRLCIDGFGAEDFLPDYGQALTAAGVQWAVFRPQRRFSLSKRRLRRLHRKLCVVDDAIGFCGGINVLDDYYDLGHGALTHPRFDFAMRLQGPVVTAINHAMRQLWAILQLSSRDLRGARQLLNELPPVQGSIAPGVHAAFVKRDNLRNRNSIERAYLQAIGHARHDILICNAYFVPSRRFARALKLAVARGVRVTLLLQGKEEYWFQHYATNAMYDGLISAGITIHEYNASFLHAKVAVIDGQWATVGSSNLDPFSLLLAREANVIVRDAVFAQQLQSALQTAIIQDSTPVTRKAVEQRGIVKRALNVISTSLLRVLLWVIGSQRKY